MEKDTQNGTIVYKNKTFGKGTFTGDHVHGTLGDYPHGYGVAIFSGGALDGYFKKGEFLKGKMSTPVANFDGIYEREYLIEGRADLKNGDYYEGVFRDKTDIKKFRKTTDYGAVFEGEVIHTQAQDGINLGLARGTLREQDGSVQKGVFFVTLPNNASPNYKTQVENFSKNRFTFTLMSGKANIHFADGALFKGFRINGAENVNMLGLSLHDGAMLAQAINHTFDSSLPLSTQFNLGAEAVLIKDKSYQEIVNGVESKPNFFGILTLNSGGKKCTMSGYFDIYRQDFNAKPVRAYVLTSGTVTAELEEGTLSATNSQPMHVYTDGTRVASPLKYVSGTLSDTKNATVYTGLFEFDQSRAKEFELDLAKNLNSGLKFVHGTIEATKKGPDSTLSFVVKNGPNFVRSEGEIVYSNGDYKKGEFDLEIKRGAQVEPRFIRGTRQKTIDTTAQNGKKTVYTLENFDLAPRKFGFLENPKLQNSATYFGDIISTSERADGMRMTHSSGAFSGDFEAMDFDLIEGDINSTLTGANGYSRVLSIIRVLMDGYPVFRGNQTTRNLNSDSLGKIERIVEAGEFEYDGESASLLDGMLSLNTQNTECNLETKNGERFVGKTVTKIGEASYTRLGEFVMAEPYTFLLSKGEIEYIEPEKSYHALFDAEGIGAFDGAKFAGTLDDRRAGTREIITTDDLSSVFPASLERVLPLNNAHSLNKENFKLTSPKKIEKPKSTTAYREMQ